MGMTGAGETHTVEVEVDGPKSESDTKEFMKALRELLAKYHAKVGRQTVCIPKKSRPPDPPKS
jgi:hypothetical protein